MISVAISFIIGFIIYRLHRREVAGRKEIITQFSALQLSNALSNAQLIRDMNEVITAQNTYIAALQDQRALMDSKVQEISELLPRIQHHEGAAAVMFQKLEDAEKLIAQHAPNSELREKLKELLQ